VINLAWELNRPCGSSLKDYQLLRRSRNDYKFDAKGILGLLPLLYIYLQRNCLMDITVCVINFITCGSSIFRYSSFAEKITHLKENYV
jgi:hypothetical protein